MKTIHLQESIQEMKQRMEAIPRSTKCRAKAEAGYAIIRAISTWLERSGLPQEISGTRRGRLIQAMKSKPDSVILAFKSLNNAHGKLSSKMAQSFCVKGEIPCSCFEVHKQRTNPSVYSFGRGERKSQ
ncbi:hypothetical protein QMM42_07765 [Leptospira santarosai]|uniref:hypothetical protein n=1 Tax=Leptospira santarosai TaxID=28183 RepID=UPI0024AF43C1|nr:hypothetical protein [Leptospira santarosai]MDI7186100.1 hypothetical protein [Leptospira santarosai]MDI7200141.1 hypothetical protein [Leptospira santarosai]MDI7213792.1 hypothetical protein [Leptospira santarosai]